MSRQKKREAPDGASREIGAIVQGSKRHASEIDTNNVLKNEPTMMEPLPKRLDPRPQQERTAVIDSHNEGNSNYQQGFGQAEVFINPLTNPVEGQTQARNYLMDIVEPINRPHDVFLIHTGVHKHDIAVPMKDVLEGYHPQLRCFLDMNMAPRHGAPTKQMEDALETCRYAVVILSWAFLMKKYPRAELRYAFHRLDWITQHFDWHSLYVVFVDLTLEEYARHRTAFPEKRLPDLSPRVVVHQYNAATTSWPNLHQAMATDMMRHDAEGAYAQWKNLLRGLKQGTIRQEKNFPPAVDLYADTLREEQSLMAAANRRRPQWWMIFMAALMGILVAGIIFSQREKFGSYAIDEVDESDENASVAFKTPNETLLLQERYQFRTPYPLKVCLEQGPSTTENGDQRSFTYSLGWDDFPLSNDNHIWLIIYQVGLHTSKEVLDTIQAFVKPWNDRKGMRIGTVRCPWQRWFCEKRLGQPIGLDVELTYVELLPGDTNPTAFMPLETNVTQEILYDFVLKNLPLHLIQHVRDTDQLSLVREKAAKSKMTATVLLFTNSAIPGDYRVLSDTMHQLPIFGLQQFGLAHHFRQEIAFADTIDGSGRIAMELGLENFGRSEAPIIVALPLTSGTSVSPQLQPFVLRTANMSYAAVVEWLRVTVLDMRCPAVAPESGVTTVSTVEQWDLLWSSSAVAGLGHLRLYRREHDCPARAFHAVAAKYAFSNVVFMEIIVDSVPKIWNSLHADWFATPLRFYPYVVATHASSTKDGRQEVSYDYPEGIMPTNTHSIEEARIPSNINVNQLEAFLQRTHFSVREVDIIRDFENHFVPCGRTIVGSVLLVPRHPQSIENYKKASLKFRGNFCFGLAQSGGQVHELVLSIVKEIQRKHNEVQTENSVPDIFVFRLKSDSSVTVSWNSTETMGIETWLKEDAERHGRVLQIQNTFDFDEQPHE